MLLAACSRPSKTATGELAKAESSAQPASPALHHVIVPSPEGNGYGYDIYMGDKLYIHQPTIPAVAGNKGFSSSEKAERTAAFVEQKILNNIIPPAVTPEELDSLGVLR